MGAIADTFEWCRTCGLVDPKKEITNYGGECCTLNLKRAAGKCCDSWIRMSEKQEKLYFKINK